MLRVKERKRRSVLQSARADGDGMRRPRADFSVAWVPLASPLPSFSARMCLGRGRASYEA